MGKMISRTDPVILRPRDSSWKDISSVLFDLKPELVQCDCINNFISKPVMLD